MKTKPGNGIPAETYDVTPCLMELKALVQRTWEPGIRFELHAPLAMPAVAWCRESLQHALMNILSNAREAMPSGGLISLVASAHPRESAATEIQICVTDSGLGMTRDTLHHATDPFFTTKAGGMGGLGLPIVVGFVEEVGGSLRIESEPGVGTVVTVTLPVPTQMRMASLNFNAGIDGYHRDPTVSSRDPRANLADRMSAVNDPKVSPTPSDNSVPILTG